jgi:hypothetical protein
LALDQEWQTYQRELPNLIDESGKYALIFGDDIVEVYDTYDDAVTDGLELTSHLWSSRSTKLNPSSISPGASVLRASHNVAVYKIISLLVGISLTRQILLEAQASSRLNLKTF